MPWQLSVFCFSEEKIGGSWRSSLGAFVAIESKQSWLCRSASGELTVMCPEGEINVSFGTLWISLFQQTSLSSLVLHCLGHQCWWWVKWECELVYLTGLHFRFLSAHMLKKGQRSKMKQRNNSRISACSMSSPVDTVILLQRAGWCWGSEARCRWGWFRLNV